MYKLILLGALSATALATQASTPLLFGRGVVSCEDQGQKACGTGCIDKSYTCCPDLAGGCPATAYCALGDNQEYGCCPNGKVCGGDGGAITDKSTVTSTISGKASTSTSTVTYTSKATTTLTTVTTSATGKPPSDYTTSTVYATTIKTITSCASTVAHCPASSTVVVTQVVAISTTICPVASISTSTKMPPPPSSSTSTPYYPPGTTKTTTYYPTGTGSAVKTSTTSRAAVTAGAAENYGVGGAMKVLGVVLGAAAIL